MVGDSKGEEGNSHGDEKQMFSKQMCLGPAETMGHRVNSDL